MREKDNTRK